MCIRDSFVPGRIRTLFYNFINDFIDLLQKFRFTLCDTDSCPLCGLDVYKRQPTLFAGYAADDASIPYWISVNDAVPVSGEQGLFRQNIHSDAWQTVYANQNAKNWDPGTPYGISRVQVSEDGSMTAVSYTHLDVYKRQPLRLPRPVPVSFSRGWKTALSPPSIREHADRPTWNLCI